MTDIEAIAAASFAALGAGTQIDPFSRSMTEFDLNDAYRVTAAVREARQAAGQTPIGRKIGFTNRTIWDEYGVFAPMWGYVYDATVRDLADLDGEFSLAGQAEPRIEPEVIFHLASTPSPEMDARALLGCIDRVAHGFEIVQSIFPGWVFAPADTVAAYGLHGALLIGPWHNVADDFEGWLANLSSFEIDLYRNGELIDHGRAANVLDGPLLALKHLVELLESDPDNPQLAAGEIVTTGTLTRAFPIVPGETWSTAPSGVDLAGVSVRYTE